MDLATRDSFAQLWQQYFNRSELPIAFFYTNESGHAEEVPTAESWACLIESLSGVREGRPLAFKAESIGCPGGKRYTGFTQKLMPNFEYFLSCGVPGKMEGERYKKAPELVKEAMKHMPPFAAPARFIVFKRWDLLQESDNPEVVIFFALPDVLSGLFTLANFDEGDPNGVIAPFGSGCSSIVLHPYLEGKSHHPRAVIGMFDVSARPFVPANLLSFAVPFGKFSQMIANMDESFLITASWRKVQGRIP